MVLAAFLTHGNDGSLEVYDGKFRVKEIENSIGSAGLINKPKVLLFQACRGSLVDIKREITSINTQPSTSREENNDEQIHFSVSKHLDMMTMFPSLPDHISFGIDREGTWFVNAFCDVLRHYSDKEICEILKVVNRITADITGSLDSRLLRYKKKV